MPSTYEYPWEVTLDKVEAAVRKIIEASRPAKVILFGSFVRGETTVNSSDIGILVELGENLSLLDVVGIAQESERIRS